ncbi:hypothetical protein A3G98_00885 [Candidatus Nomurabacteria bacterium RIFCSPLOWO2_12_FULL_37_8]|uniref:DUF418 domain-containing protein n=1 Tax=Candidatus Nomurabacteria bacterium RIFCSPLOWO2_12_FULL_37_8 TaxID=1801793 RepID=A0A1F6Y509_9BACT|nr:MAG: hypothetical protein A3G98_00885 [Candidatus Nomurabacteria bacterium RIFCSPLOWO2_12_FULL_37_8]
MIAKFLQREKYVVIHGQTRKFRITKWLILILVSFLLYMWKGTSFVGLLWVTLAVLGTTFHFFLRYKTRGWRQPWGPVKEIKTPFD